MECEQIQERLGAYFDGEIRGSTRDAFERHLASCPACRQELKSLGRMAKLLSGPGAAPVPKQLWTSIEQRLDATTQNNGVRPTDPVPRRMRLAVAAAVILAIGIGLIGFSRTESRAQASHVDFRVLLDALPLDAQKAFRKFLTRYDARETSPNGARHYAPKLTFEIPQTLPGGFRFGKVYTLRFGESPGIAATYLRDGEFLGAIFHPPVQTEDFGTHRDHPCVVGNHRGHTVAVGEWKLVHLADATTCHCVLSRLNEQTELPQIMTAVTRDLDDESAEDH